MQTIQMGNPFLAQLGQTAPEWAERGRVARMRYSELYDRLQALPEGPAKARVDAWRTAGGHESTDNIVHYASGMDSVLDFEKMEPGYAARESAQGWIRGLEDRNDQFEALLVEAETELAKPEPAKGRTWLLVASAIAVAAIGAPLIWK